MTVRDALVLKKLSVREVEVAEKVMKGLTNKEVANELFVTEKTIKFHLTSIYKKLDVKSRSQLIVWASKFSSDGTLKEEAREMLTLDPLDETLPKGTRMHTGIGTA